ncbi:hypothetical protein PAAG_01981 [Paracoccidioides lutzii Pb01]|uniref:Uncharacterized protein n=1 Tax=Paracoccidioides lutzii (strain ATCC MYA-826 / Pb01) TaxID=502779 RepID=C1GTY6_PARBA|nr:hypothetical protein PAAG_01981 [Paracoccidioides lutzii Pb01]EEH39792.1 hypothetical protein PAAG_01981 [Paracoccidioides lutzii Pb01]
MSTGDHTANPHGSQYRDNNDDELRFRRPQRNGLPKDSLYQSQIPTLSPGNDGQSRVAFSNTRTLKGAFQAAAAGPPRPASPGREQKTPPGRAMARERKFSEPSPMSEVSNPPYGQSETYQHINDADDLVGSVAQDDYNIPYVQPRRERTRSASPSPGARRYEEEYAGAGDPYDSSLSFSDISDESLRQKLAQHAMDEGRLNRVTHSQSPVFSKANVGPKAALSLENIQRRNEEELFRYDVEPSFNVPKTWGLRGRVSKDWLSKVSRRNGNDNHVQEELVQPVDQGLENDIDFTARSLQVSNSPPVRNNAPARSEIEDLGKKRPATNSLGEIKRKESQEHIRPPIEGDPIPNTPIVIYRNAEREKKPRHLSKNDPQELLRTLSRRESPSVASTPEQNQVDNTLLNVKTPVVTGAWIDTPVPDRAAEPVAASQQDSTVDINSPSMKARNQTQNEVHNPTQNQRQNPSKIRHQVDIEKTPQDSKERQELQKEPRPEPKPRRAPLKLLEKPKLPRSALEAVIEDAKSGDHSLVLGENTIDSLQELLDENSLLDSKAFIKSENDEEEDKIKIETLGQADDSVIERLDTKLKSLVRSINATQSGLASLERQIAKDSNILALRNTKQTNKMVHHSHTNSPCDVCGVHSGGRNHVAISLPRLWYRQPDTHRLRLTRLSWFVIVIFTWCISELVMCDYYCHPMYASTCERNCLDPNAPRMPLVIPTMLWRWSGLSVILKPVGTVLVAGFRDIAQLFGIWDGFFDGPPDGEWPVWDYYQETPAYQPSFEQFEPSVDMGMMQDEYV